jgi:4'-phosphopantetheinyl transferase
MMPTIHWPVPSKSKPRLGQDDIHLWCADLGEFSRTFPELYRVLSAQERAKAGRFRFPKDHDHFVIQNGLLRFLLSRYLPIAPAHHELIRGPYGKPELAHCPEAERLHFNMSHSSSLALYAVARATAVGVDIERIRPMDDLENIARGFFTAHETAALCALPVAKRLEAFFSCWTRKEAVLKATGQGIAEGVDGVEVTAVPGEVVRVLSIKGSAQAAAGWSLHALEPATGYAAALAYQGPKRDLCCWTFSLSLLKGEVYGIAR